jgi:hypothetical protein
MNFTRRMIDPEGTISPERRIRQRVANGGTLDMALWRKLGAPFCTHSMQVSLDRIVFLHNRFRQTPLQVKL